MMIFSFLVEAVLNGYERTPLFTLYTSSGPWPLRLHENLILSSEMIIKIGHRKEIQKPTFKLLALRKRIPLMKGWRSKSHLPHGGQFTLERFSIECRK